VAIEILKRSVIKKAQASSEPTDWKYEGTQWRVVDLPFRNSQRGGSVISALSHGFGKDKGLNLYHIQPGLGSEYNWVEGGIKGDVRET